MTRQNAAMLVVAVVTVTMGFHWPAMLFIATVLTFYALLSRRHQ